ncbi:MAG: membrane-associated HD superfamily hydrolase [Candidatus Desulfovibrio kirbyi]|uniref:Membrane-associated HD superfamily hydrolase n=1 Tax=Candidatus Desulfovibrio kirbyi TaxID=2696086 RepID=A0A6L2R515_9BACT|nr:MAG: membrane-associated HD superfamily hydrolase [Candidatus Desulfovibrio kirbyi]
MITQIKTDRPTNVIRLFKMLKAHHQCGWGLWALIGTLLLLSLLAGANFIDNKRIYVAGQVAENDIVADHNISVEDTQATNARRKQALSFQPLVYDLSLESYLLFHGRMTDLFRALNNQGSGNPEDDEQVARLSEDLSPAVAEDILPDLILPHVQAYLFKVLLPIIREQLANGLAGDIRAAQVGRAGVIIHNLDTNRDVLRPDLTVLPDVQSFLAEISSRMRQEPTLSPQSRRAINILLSATMPSSLTLNREATQKRGADVIATLEPVYYHIQKGEMIVRKGERVSREQQIKLQTLHQSSADPMHWRTVAGAFFCALLLSVGFFLSPSGKLGTPLKCKDALLISLMLLLCGAGAKGLYIFMHMQNMQMLNAVALAFPLSGAVGLMAMIFATRRYCTTSLLFSLFCMLMLQETAHFFLFHFLGAMLITWLVISAQTRQDVVWSVVPLTVGQILIWFAMALLDQTPAAEFPSQLLAVFLNSVVSLILLFAVSPVLEMVFGYSTRFRLMELMSLEQPLMQNLMVTIPGTYHHSLLVANLVEAGAKAIGANSLLCKVAALYHDVGKLAYPEYFIENQFGGANKHDKLSPSMSSLILLSHVKKGTELAERYDLGQEITDIIRQHHGTRLMRFFYQKALNLGENPHESDYNYLGPRPQSREAAVLMLADVVEASTRTLTEPTPSRIKNFIDATIKGIFSEGQLDESELTFKDLHLLGESFQRIITGIFHQRIVYPDAKMTNKSWATKTEESSSTVANHSISSDNEDMQPPGSVLPDSHMLQSDFLNMGRSADTHSSSALQRQPENREAQTFYTGNWRQ